MTTVDRSILERATLETAKHVQAHRRLQLQLDLADQLQKESEVKPITEIACALLGKYLGASRVYYSEIEDADMIFRVPASWLSSNDLPPLPSACGIADFGDPLNEAIRTGAEFVIDNVRSDPRTAPMADAFTSIAIESILIVPIKKTAHISTHINVTSDVQRNWSADELDLVNDMARRTFDAIERARAQAALQVELENTRRAEAALKMADKRRNEMLLMLAHELRNPMAPISAAADLLTLPGLREKQIQSATRIITRQVGHMANLIDNLLDVSRVTSGKTELAHVDVSLDDVLAAAVEQVQPQIVTRNHVLLQTRTAEAVYIRGDRNRLVQVVTNLLGNAARYTPAGGRIELTVEAYSADVMLRVSDNGAGMSAELAERVFDLFTQAERQPDRSQGGLGLGLPLVKALVERHGGKVTVHSAGPGQGCSFTVLLPRLQLANPVPALPPAAGLAAQPVAAPRSSMKILIVDDNTDAADTLAMLVEASGNIPTVEYHPLRALERARTLIPDACLLDIGLPDMDGYELARRLRQLPGMSGALMVAVSGYARQQDRDNAHAAGFNQHFAKPVDGTKLIDLLVRNARLIGKPAAGSAVIQ
ncbi:MAG: hybrid sensor histidine kinase/response regulator [Janthinobacterium lividum]